MTETIKVFIPAAGFGERLRPITDYIPKPLLPIAGKVLLQVILERVSLPSVGHIGINLHHKRDMMEAWLRSSAFMEKIRLFPEERIMGTGGALKNAERFLSDGMFLVHNADILSDMSLEGLIEAHRKSGNLATLAVHDFPKFNNVAVGTDGSLRGVGKAVIGRSSSEKRVAFTGVALYDPGFLKYLPDGPSSVVDAWKAAIESGRRIGTFDVSGCYWSDIGTPSAYVSAAVERMRMEGETVFVHPSAEGCRNAYIDGYVMIGEKCVLAENVSLRNCIVLPGTNITDDSRLENCIAGPDFEIALKEEEILPVREDTHMVLIGSGGSDRRYYRVREGEDSFVLVRYGPEDQDFHRHLSYTRFLRRHGMPVPALLKVNEERREAVFEDLGDLSLYSWLKCIRLEEDIESLYRKVIDIASMMHTVVTQHVSECRLLGERVFDYDHLRWETRYFMEEFVSGVRKTGVDDTSSIEEEFDKLARHVDSFPKVVMHRDFQSQNIMITRGGVPRVIDYQGARTGPPAYDIASLLWDPYYRLEKGLRERLIDYYIEGMGRSGNPDFDETAFRAALLPCRLQRHMQALGAYGFLSAARGKRYFLKYAEEGLRLLREDISSAAKEYPAIYGLVAAL